MIFLAAVCHGFPQLLNTKKIPRIYSSASSFGFGFSLRVFALPDFRFRNGSNVTRVRCEKLGEWTGVEDALSMFRQLLFQVHIHCT